MTQIPPRHPKLTPTIALAGLWAGTLDIGDAFIFYGMRGISPIRILQGIAYGLIGKQAYSQALRSAMLGLLLHFFISTSFATIYVFVSRRLPLYKHPLIYGSLYGTLIYIVMNYLVLPLSHIGLRPLPPVPALINGVAALIVCVGIPIGLISQTIKPVPVS